MAVRAIIVSIVGVSLLSCSAAGQPGGGGHDRRLHDIVMKSGVMEADFQDGVMDAARAVGQGAVAAAAASALTAVLDQAGEAGREETGREQDAEAEQARAQRLASESSADRKRQMEAVKQAELEEEEKAEEAAAAHSEEYEAYKKSGQFQKLLERERKVEAAAAAAAAAAAPGGAAADTALLLDPAESRGAEFRAFKQSELYEQFLDRKPLPQPLPLPQRLPPLAALEETAKHWRERIDSEDSALMAAGMPADEREARAKRRAEQAELTVEHRTEADIAYLESQERHAEDLQRQAPLAVHLSVMQHVSESESASTGGDGPSGGGTAARGVLLRPAGVEVEEGEGESVSAEERAEEEESFGGDTATTAAPAGPPAAALGPAVAVGGAALLALLVVRAGVRGVRGAGAGAGLAVGLEKKTRSGVDAPLEEKPARR